VKFWRSYSIKGKSFNLQQMRWLPPPQLRWILHFWHEFKRAFDAFRFVAITRPLRYVKHRTNSKRVLITLAGAWLASGVISSPIAFGMNYTETRRRTPHVCTFYNSYFLIFSSMGSFYIPCVAMLALYWKMFRTIRERARQSVLRRRQTLRNVLNVDTLAREDRALNEADRNAVRALEILIN